MPVLSVWCSVICFGASSPSTARSCFLEAFLLFITFAVASVEMLCSQHVHTHGVAVFRLLHTYSSISTLNDSAWMVSEVRSTTQRNPKEGHIQARALTFTYIIGIVDHVVAPFGGTAVFSKEGIIVYVRSEAKVQYCESFSLLTFCATEILCRLWVGLKNRHERMRTSARNLLLRLTVPMSKI